MSLKSRVVRQGIFVLAIILVSFFVLLSSNSTRAAVPKESADQFEPIKDSEQEQPIIRPELNLIVSIAPEPIVGEIATLRIEVTPTIDEPKTSLMVKVSEEINLITGNLTWNGAISPSTPLVHELSFMVKEPGDWVIYMIASASSSAVDEEQLHIISTETSAQVIPSIEYRVIQPMNNWHSDPARLIPYEISQTLFKAKITDEWSPQATGQVTIQGNITFDFEYQDCTNSNWSCPGLGTGIFSDTMPLRNAQIRLYDRATVGDNTYLATAITEGTASNSGFYTFTINNIDPDGDGTGIDPLFEIFPTGPEGSEKVTIVDAIGEKYVETVPLPDNDLGDGIYLFDYNIAHQTLQSDMGQVMYIFDQIANEAYGFLEDEISWSHTGVVKVNYPQGCLFGLTDDPCYIGETDGIAIPEVDGRRSDVIIHEYGHYVLSRYLGDFPVVEACAPVYEHFFDVPTIRPACAWSEGWADFFQMAVQNDPDYKGRGMEVLESDSVPTPGDNPASWEAAVVATLWDIFDGTGTESSGFVDNISDGFNGAADNGIWFLTTQMANNPNDIVQFWDLWIANRTSEVDVGCELLDQHQLLYTLTIDIVPPNGGNVNISNPLTGFDCPASSKFLDTRMVQLGNVPATDFDFFRWSGEIVSSDNTVSFTMDSDKSITAEFISSASPTPSATPSSTPTNTPTPSPTPDPNYLTRLTGADGGWSPAMSDNGQFVAYAVYNGNGASVDIIRYDRVIGVAEVVVSGVSVSPIALSEMDISEDGRYIVYSARGVNTFDIFLLDYQTGITENISSSITPPSQGDAIINIEPRIAVVNNNPIIAFTSRLNWVNNTMYLYEPGQTLAEINPTNLPNNPDKSVEDISVDSNEILYRTETQLFLFNRTTGNVQTIQPPKTPTEIHSAYLSSDPAGRYLVYSININGSCTYCFDEGKVYLLDRTTGLSEEMAFNLAWFDRLPRVSNDGRYVYYEGQNSIMVYDRVDDVLRQAAQNYPDQNAIYDISGDGQFVVFQSDSANLDPIDTNGIDDIFLIDTSLWSPPVVPTATPIPTATATPDWVRICFAVTILADSGPNTGEGYAAKPFQRFLGKMQQTTELLDLLYRLRDDVMSQTEQGQAYTSLYETHSDELSNLVLADSDLFQQAYDTLTMFTPHFQDFLDGDGTNVVITAAEVQAVQDFLDNVIAVGSPALQQTIAQERANLPLENFIGLTANDAWAQFNSGTNLLQNGGFESGIAPWNNNGGLNISTDAFSGNNALQVGSDASTSQAISVMGSGQTYTFSGYAKRNGSQWAGIGINYFDSSGSIISQQNLPITSASYEFFSLSVAAPANAVMMAVWANNTAGGQLYLDELSLIIDLNPPTPTPTATATSSSSNLLQNPDFEQGSTPWVAGASANMDITSDAFAGNNALRLGDATNAYQSVPGVIEGWTYTFSGYAKRSGTQWAGIGMNFFDANNNQISIQNVSITAASYDTFTLSMVAPEGAVKVHTWASNSAGAGFLFLDTLSLLASPSPSPTATLLPTVTPTPSSTPSPTATLLPTVTPTPSFTATPTASATPTPLPTITPTPFFTASPTSSPGSTFLFTPVADAFIAAQQPDGNQGGSSLLRTDSLPENLSYLKFDVQNLDGAISSAKLRLFVLDTNSFGFNIHRVDDNSWVENTITYNTRPSVGLFINTSGAIFASSWVEVDVTNYVTGGGVFTLVLDAANDAIIRYRSRETNSAPELIIETGSGATPTSTATATLGASSTPTQPPTATPTATNFPTNTPTSAATVTPGLSPTPTQLPTATPTAINTPTNTPTPLPGSTITFNPVADAFVSENQPTGNQGSSFLLRTDTVPDTRSYLKFDIQSLSGNVASATLRIFALDTMSSGFKVYAVPNNSWEENTITYATIPSTGAFIADSGATTANSWKEVDVTSFVTGNGEWNFVLIGADNNTIRYRSRESNASPELVMATGAGSMNAEQAVERVSTANAGKNLYE